MAEKRKNRNFCCGERIVGKTEDIAANTIAGIFMVWLAVSPFALLVMAVLYFSGHFVVPGWAVTVFSCGTFIDILMFGDKVIEAFLLLFVGYVPGARIVSDWLGRKCRAVETFIIEGIGSIGIRLGFC